MLNAFFNGLGSKAAAEADAAASGVVGAACVRTDRRHAAA